MTAITDNVDFERALMLMNIVEQISKVAPGFTSLSGAAMTELKEMNDEIKKAVDEESRKLAAEAQVAPQRELQNAGIPAGADTSVTGGPGVDPEARPDPVIDSAKKAVIGPRGETLIVDPEAGDEVDPEDEDSDGVADAQEEIEPVEEPYHEPALGEKHNPTTKRRL